MSVNESLLAFLLAASLLIITPGVDTALVLRTAAVEGSKRAVLAALGVNTGCLAWGALVAMGLGALIAASEWAFTLLKWAGAAYLCWLGLNMLLRPRPAALADSGVSNGQRSWFMKGLLGNLLNPKVGVFYVSFLPQFVPAGFSAAPYMFGLACIHVLLGCVWCTLLIMTTRPLSAWLKKPSVSIALDRITGIVLVGFAVKLAMTRR
jgi:RhtB (resistance to homoserine/threonine) family protein